MKINTISFLRTAVGIILMFGVLYACSSSEEGPANHLPYTIANSRSYRVAGEDCRELRVRVQVSQAPSDSDLKTVGEAIFYNGNSHYDFVRIFLYSPRDDIYSFAYTTIEYTNGTRSKYERLGQPSMWD